MKRIGGKGTVQHGQVASLSPEGDLAWEAWIETSSWYGPSGSHGVAPLSPNGDLRWEAWIETLYRLFLLRQLLVASLSRKGDLQWEARIETWQTSVQDTP